MSNGFECEWCDQRGYWDCGPEPRCQDAPPPPGEEAVQEAVELEGPWKLVDVVALQAGTTYYVKCRPGCEARVDEHNDVAKPWILVGTVVPGTPGQGPAGEYKLFCRSGGGEACNAALVPK